MKILRGVLLALFAATLFSTFSPSTRADEWDKKTIVTFSEAVEVSGQVLPPGTYVFKLFNSSSDRHIVQVWDADETQIITTVIAISTERSEPADNSIFEFDERPVDQPVALRTWFYPGDAIGRDFTYSYHYRR
jgi:hypothetical protein